MKVGGAVQGDMNWCDSRTSAATRYERTPPTTSVLTFSNTTVCISHIISYDVIQVSVAPRMLARSKWLILEIFIWNYELF
jgi:hypothetical protein